MKTSLLLFMCLALSGFFCNLQAQWITSGDNIYYNKGKAGIGINPVNHLHSASYNNTVSASAYFWGELYGTAVGVKSTSANYYAFSVMNNITNSGAGGTHLFTVRSDGNVGIGISNLTKYSARLTVAGDIHAREVKVETNAGADFVFDDHYPLRSLSEVEQFITRNKHLPGIAPADSMVQNGVDMGDMQIKLLQKIEELTLYTIEQQRQIDTLVNRIGKMENKK